MPRSDPDVERLVESYYSYWLASRSGEVVPKAVDVAHWWAVEHVQDLGMEGTLPLRLVDALLHAPGADEEFRAYVAAGPVENLLGEHGRANAVAIASRCQTDPLWAEAARGVWLSREQWEELPPSLQRLVPEPERLVSKGRRSRKQPSRRQKRRPRHA